MKNFLKLLLIGWVVFSCRTSDGSLSKEKHFDSFTSVAVQTLLEDSLSIRAIKVINDKIWYVSQQGKYGALDFEGNVVFEGIIERNNSPQPLRGISSDNHYVYLMAIQKPAAIYRHLLSDLSVFEKVYEDLHPEAFFNTIIFDNNGKGVVFGDTYDHELYLLKTEDGQHWKRVKSDQLPVMEKGEHAFAASNTVAMLNNEKIWLASGGSKARVFYSKDFGKTWLIQNTSILSGSPMKGIFSLDFYDDHKGVLAGGDYDMPDFFENNLAITNNGGGLWSAVSSAGQQEHPGFISCVKFVPSGEGNHLVSIGSNGIFYTDDGAINWKKFSGESKLYTFEFISSNQAIAAGKNKIIMLDFSAD